MYTVFATIKSSNGWVESLLYHPQMINDGFVIYNPVITLEDNKAGSFQFRLPVTNNLYNSLSKLKSIITVYDNDSIIFQGRVLNDERDFNNNKLVYCEGRLAYLLDSVVRPTNFKGTVTDFFTNLIENHNSQVDDFKKFEIGQCNVNGDEEITIALDSYSSTFNVVDTYLIGNYEGHLIARFENNKCYLDYLVQYPARPSQDVVFGHNLLDLTQYISAENIFTRLIPLGKSVPVDLTDEEIGLPKDISSGVTEEIKNKADSDASKFVFSCDVQMTAVNRADPEQLKCTIKITYKGKLATGSNVSWSGLDGSKIYADIKLNGKEIKKEGKGSFTFTNEFKPILEYTGEVDMTNTTVTCEFVNQYTTKDTKPISNSMALVANLVQQKYVYVTIESVNNKLDYIENTNAIEQFGLITSTNIWNDEDDPAKLKAKAEEYLAKNIEMNVSLEISAIDLSLLGASPDSFKMGDLVRVISAPHGLTGENLFEIKKVTLDLQSPENNIYSMGVSYTTLTETQVNTQNHINLTADQIATIVNDVNYQYTVTEQVSALVEQVYDHYADIQTVIDNLSVTYADIDFANIGTASVKNLFADKAVLTDAEIAALQAESASISQILAKGLTANTAFIENLTSSNAFITNLTANNAFINDLTTNHLDAKYLYAGQANFDTLFANAAFIGALNTAVANINTLAADSAFVGFLTGKYADIDLLNVSNANAANLIVHSGMVTNATIQQGFVTGELNAVTINGNLINANTLKANRLLVQGPDGIYYRLNLTHKDNGDITTAQWNALTDDQKNSYLHGTNLIAKSVTADQIAAGTITANELSVAITGEDYDGSTSLMSLKTGIEGITNTVNNWRVGGRNLLRNSRLYKSPLADIEGAVHPQAWGANGGTTFLAYVNGEATRVVNFPTVTANTWREIESYPKMLYSRIRNQTVTVSCEVWAENGADCGMNFCLLLCNSEEDSRKKYRNYYKYFTGTGDWQKIFVVIDVTDAYFTAGTDITVGYDSAYFGLRPGATNSKWDGFKARCFMVELGNTPTDWTQAPEDGEEYTNTIIDQRKDEIVLAAHSYTKIGGTNLLRNTASDWGEWITPSANTSNQSSAKSRYQVDEEDLKYFKPGNLLTFSFDIEFSGATPGTGGTGQWYYQSYADKNGTSDWNKINWNGNGLGSKLPIADGVYHYTATAEIPSTMDYTTDTTYYRVQIRTDYWNGTGKYRLRNVKLETGNTETAWSPSPADTEDRFNDVEQKITAAKFNIQDDQISASVSQFIGDYLDDNDYATGKDITDATSGLVSTTKLSQTATAIRGEVSSVGNRVNKLEQNDASYNTWFTFDADALTIGKTGSPVKANLTNTALNFTDGTNILASVSSTNGLVGKEVQVGDTTTDNLRWRLTTNSTGDHFRITRHQ